MGIFPDLSAIKRRFGTPLKYGAPRPLSIRKRIETRVDYPTEMKSRFNIKTQPDYTSCGPSSLYSVYEYLGVKSSFEQVVDRVHQFDEGGGTLGVVLGIDALKEGLDVTLYSYNINIFDPSWFEMGPTDLVTSLKKRQSTKILPEKEKIALSYYIQYLEMGGRIAFKDLSRRLLEQLLADGNPVLTGLSASWLYRSPRENSVTNEYDDILGDPAGHFVVVYDYNPRTSLVEVADPYKPNPISGTNYYGVTIERLFTAILLGITTFDGNLLVIRKKSNSEKHSYS